jgi:hypothetical protein
VLGGLFKVRAVQFKHRPQCAAVAVHYLDHWYYIDMRDVVFRQCLSQVGQALRVVLTRLV